jgi:hypothetical protein
MILKNCKKIGSLACLIEEGRWWCSNVAFVQHGAMDILQLLQHVSPSKYGCLQNDGSYDKFQTRRTRM